MTYPAFCSESVFEDIKNPKQIATEYILVIEEEELFLQTGIRANIFLNYKHKMWQEYIPKPFLNQMGAINLWATQVNKVNVIPDTHVSDIGVKLSCSYSEQGKKSEAMGEVWMS